MSATCECGPGEHCRVCDLEREATMIPVTGQTILLSMAKQYRCPIHGDIGEQTLSSTIPGFEMKLCLRCYLTILKRVGVQEVTEIGETAMSMVPCDTPSECRLRESGGSTTCAYYPPVYDSAGNNTNPDLNVTSSTLTCLSCGKVFDVQSCNGERTVRERA